MNAKPTKPQDQALRAILSINETGKAAHCTHIRSNRGVFERLEKAGWITSGRPFAYAYHSMHVTAAGRAALHITPTETEGR